MSPIFRQGPLGNHPCFFFLGWFMKHHEPIMNPSWPWADVQRVVEDQVIGIGRQLGQNFLPGTFVNSNRAHRLLGLPAKHGDGSPKTIQKPTVTIKNPRFALNWNSHGSEEKPSFSGRNQSFRGLAILLVLHWNVVLSEVSSGSSCFPHLIRSHPFLIFRLCPSLLHVLHVFPHLSLSVPIISWQFGGVYMRLIHL